jgi:EmrB/QacA subfamily drug resistance transporter
MAKAVARYIGKEAVKAEETPKKQTSHWLILILLALAQFMVVLDVSIVNVAVPSIQRAFHMSETNLQWIITAYTLAFGGFLLLGGRAADLFGRRRTFLLGTMAFTFFSLLDGLSQSGTMIIITRGFQGLSAAFMSPSALSIVLVTYREGHERNVALSVWGAVASGGAAVGVLFGGIFTQYLGWRWNFFINVPVGILVIITSLRILDKHESESTHRHLDLSGAALVTGGLMVMVYGLVKAPQYGWGDHRTLIYFVIALAALIGFVFNERKKQHPLMRLDIFKIRNLTGANLIMLMMAAGLFSIFFFVTLYMQDVLKYSPVKTGVDFLVVPIAIAITATNVPRIIKKIGYKPPLMIAPLVVSGGLFWVSHIPVDGSYWKNVAPGMILLGLGMGITFVSATICATSGVGPQDSGLASGLLNTSQQIGGSVGLAVLSGVAASASTSYIKDLGLRAHAHATAMQTSAASVHGYHDGFLIASCFGIGASLVATFVIKNSHRPNVAAEPAAMA